MQFIDDLSQLHQMGKKKEKEKFVSKSLARFIKYLDTTTKNTGRH